ncbi:TetR/AcrR family transcriptional regulator [Pleurocapsales cyanobacterium LEGE 06147]|nr:TetR/AcrR family transcriptional regulator [Pleurocapsales cyanobacterium LEGE 06147]
MTSKPSENNALGAESFRTQRPQSPSPRRSERSHQAILTAATELLEEKGYVNTSIEGIARRAGVGKQTIYRWWSSKARLIMEAYTAKVVCNMTVPDTGSVQKDLCHILDRLFAVLTTKAAGAVMTGIMAEAQSDRDLAIAFREKFIYTPQETMLTILNRGIERGELYSNLNLELTMDMLYGPVWYRLLLKDGALDTAFAEELVIQLLRGIRV